MDWARMTDRFCISRAPSVDETRHFIDTLRDAATLRLESGSHPEDAMCIALDLINACAAVHVDGSAEYIYHFRGEQTITTLRAEPDGRQMLLSTRASDALRWKVERCEGNGAGQCTRDESHHKGPRESTRNHSRQCAAHSLLVSF
jgi:hypothetical protein